jgi:MATE family multidrug resistance protein
VTIDRRILRLAVPALGTLAIDPLVSLTDTVFVAQLGEVPLAALGVDTAVFSFAFFLFNFLAYGTTPLLAGAIGRGDPVGAGRIAWQAVVLAITAGVVAMVLLQVFAEPILGLMGAGGEVTDPALVYLRIRALAAPAVVLIIAANGVFRGLQDTRTPLVVTVAISLLNLVLDPLLIFVAGWGIAGAATATAVAQWLGAVWFLALLARSRRRGDIPWSVPRLDQAGPLLRAGRDIGLRTFALVGFFTLATAQAARVGTAAVAAHQVASQLWLLLALVVDALAIAAQAMVGLASGRGDRIEVRRSSVRLLWWGAGAGLALGALVAVAADSIVALFGASPAVSTELAVILPVIAVSEPLSALVFVGDGIYLGASRFAFLAVTTVAAAAIGSAVMLGAVALGWGLLGVWTGTVALVAARAVGLATGYRSVISAPSG